MVHSVSSRYRSHLAGAAVLSLAVLVAEVAAGLLSNSLALLSDAVHTFADVSGLVLALAAVWMAHRPTTAGRSFGLYRLEILAATANGLLLLAVAGLVLFEAVQRLGAAPVVASAPVIVVAAGALAANLISLRLLAPGRAASLTVRGAYLEVTGDLLGASAVLVAGLLIALTGFTAADALASILIAVLIAMRTVGLLRDSLDVLLEAVPKDVDLAEVRRHILDSPGVDAVHDLHAWTITSGMNVVSAHVVMGPDGNPGGLLDHLAECLAGDFDIDHSTFQIETAEHVIWEGASAHTQH